VTELAAMAHGAGVKFAYTMTMGASVMADSLIAAQVDLLYYVDPVQDKTNLAQVKERFHGILESGGGRPERSRRVALAGGVNSAVTLGSGTPEQIRAAVHDAVRTLGPDGYILAPVDAIFPDTPWESVAAMIAAWKEVR
jgi:uroporphyrinogen-III decarboxylase